MARVSKALAASLARTPSAGNGSRSDEGGKYTKPGQRAFPWVPEEVEQLVALRADRRTLPQIADHLGRPVSCVQKKWAAERRARGLERERGWVISDHAQHFWSRVDQSAGPAACWPWTKARYDNGYGVARFNMGDGWKNSGAHRISFYLTHGRPPSDGLHVLHSCDNKICCNPAHLNEGTHAQNMKEAWERGRTVLKTRAGEEHPQTTLTEAQVKAIRRLRGAGAKRRDIADAVGISLGAIDNIISRRSWSSVD